MAAHDETQVDITVVFLSLCIFTIFWMIQGAGLFYSGLTRRTSALIQFTFSTIALAIVSLQWFTIGYSLSYSKDKTRLPFIGNLKHFMLSDLIHDESVDGLVHALFAGMFCSVTAAILIGAAAERGRAIAMAVFIALWATFIYDPIAFSVWNTNGWASKLGVVDYAGGITVHINAGFSGLAYSYMLGPRLGLGTDHVNYRPHNSILVVLGTALMWVGWMGFLAGSSFNPDMQSVLSMLNAQVAAAMGAITWVLMDYRLDQKWSIVGLCSGIVAGLASVTPAAGYITPGVALFFGLIGGLSCNLATKIKFYVDIDDALDILAVHGIGGIVGSVMTGLFVTSSIGGSLRQTMIQLVVGTIVAFYSFGMSALVLQLLTTCGLAIRASPLQEAIGLDIAEHDEYAYDYVGGDLYEQYQSDDASSIVESTTVTTGSDYYAASPHTPLLSRPA